MKKKIIAICMICVMITASLAISISAYDYDTSAFWNVQLLGNHEVYVGNNVRDLQCYVRVNGNSSSTDSIYMYIKNHVLFTNQPELTRPNDNTYIPGVSSGNAAYANAAISDWGATATYNTSYSEFYFENLTLGIKQNTSYMY